MGKARKVVNKVPLVSRYEAKAMSWCLANEFVVDFQASRMDNGTVKSVSIILISFLINQLCWCFLFSFVNALLKPVSFVYEDRDEDGERICYIGLATNRSDVTTLYIRASRLELVLNKEGSMGIKEFKEGNAVKLIKKSKF